MRVLVTGGSGNVGVGVVRALNAARHHVVVASRGYSPALLPEGVRAVRLERTEPDAYTRLVAAEKPDAVIDLTCHDAADAAVTLRACAGVDRVVVVSSVTAAGPATTTPVTEATAAPPLSEYGIDKLAVEETVRAAWADGTSQALLVRLGAVYRLGADLDGQLAEDGCWLAHAAAGAPAVLADDGAARWNLLHADDAGAALAELLANDRARGVLVHLASRHPLPWRELYERVHHALGRPFNPVSVPAEWAAEQLEDAEFLAETSRWDQVFDLGLLDRLAPSYQERGGPSRVTEVALWLIRQGRVGDAELGAEIQELPARLAAVRTAPGLV